MEFDKKEMLALAIVFLLSAGIWNYPERTTLPEFSEAMKMRAALSGSAAPLHSQAAAFLLQIYAAVGGVPADSPDTIVSFLLLLPSLLLAASAALVFLSLRACSQRRAVSALVSLLFSFSATAAAFLPGVYSAEALGAFLFSLFLLCFCHYSAKSRPLLLIPSAIAAMLSAYVAPAFGIAVAAAALSFAADRLLRGKKEAWALAALAAFAALASFFSPQFPLLLPSAQGVWSLLAGSPFMLAAASCAVALFLFGLGSREHFLLALFSPIVAAFSPLAGALALALPAGEGISKAAAQIPSRRAALACIFAAAFFASSGLLLPVAGAYRAAAVSAMAAALFPLMLHLYGYKSREAFSLLFFCLLVLSASGAFFHSLSPSRPAYLDPDLARALSYLSAKGADSVSLLGFADAARFYLPSARLGSQGLLSSYLLSGEGMPQEDYVLLSLSYLDSPASLYQKGTPAFSAFSYAGNFSGTGADFALFSSRDGIVMARELDSSGGFALKDAVLLDSSGREYGSFPLSRLLLLRQDLHFSGPQNRIIALEEGALPPYFMEIYAGGSGLQKAAEFGSATVYEVK